MATETLDRGPGAGRYRAYRRSGSFPDSGTRLRIQNTDANARLFVKTTAAAPSAGDRAHVVEPGKWSPPFGFFADTAAGPFGTWAWSDREDCTIAASEDVTV